LRLPVAGIATEMELLLVDRVPATADQLLANEMFVFS
jgi:hypothetical protein